MSSVPSDLLLWAIGGLWTLMAVRGVRDMLALRLPPPLRSGPAGLPRVSVVVAARDEEARIETAVRHLLAQQAVELEVIVVDDRSADRTGEILRRLADEAPRLHVVRVDELPD